MGFTRGYTGMLFRDAPGFGVYFCIYEFNKRLVNLPKLEEDPNHSKADIALRRFMSGGTAGVITWFTCYPMDTVKTTMQTYEGKDRLKFTHTIVNLYRT
jgi:solute carrier family 25 carnitine/acylcarnitine transporter 20/29